VERRALHAPLPQAVFAAQVKKDCVAYHGWNIHKRHLNIFTTLFFVSPRIGSHVFDFACRQKLHRFRTQ
jgi:hypothetical protein